MSSFQEASQMACTRCSDSRKTLVLAVDITHGQAHRQLITANRSIVGVMQTLFSGYDAVEDAKAEKHRVWCAALIVRYSQKVNVPIRSSEKSKRINITQ